MVPGVAARTPAIRLSRTVASWFSVSKLMPMVQARLPWASPSVVVPIQLFSITVPRVQASCTAAPAGRPSLLTYP